MPRLITRADLRRHRPATVNALADRIAALLEEDLRSADREVLRCAYLTLAFRFQADEGFADARGLLCRDARCAGAGAGSPVRVFEAMFAKEPELTADTWLLGVVPSPSAGGVHGVWRNLRTFGDRFNHP